MSRLRNAVCVLFLLGSLHGMASSPSDFSAAIEPVLRDALALPQGPATQFTSFDIEGTDMFVVVTTDFAMGNAKPTPFGNQPGPKSKPDQSRVLSSLKQALKACSALHTPKGVLYLILIDRPFFSNPFSSNTKPTTYKAWIPLQALSGVDLDTSIRIETAETR